MTRRPTEPDSGANRWRVTAPLPCSDITVDAVI